MPVPTTRSQLSSWRRTVGVMKKRAFALALWFYTGWYAGAIVAWALGVSPLVGPLLGAAAAAIFVGIPPRTSWTRTEA